MFCDVFPLCFSNGQNHDFTEGWSSTLYQVTKTPPFILLEEIASQAHIETNFNVCCLFV